MSGRRNAYVIAMKTMILDIAFSIGDIQNVNCFTPILGDSDYFEYESYEDMAKIENFFKDNGYSCKFVSDLDIINDI